MLRITSLPFRKKKETTMENFARSLKKLIQAIKKNTGLAYISNYTSYSLVW